jgi:DNA-binding transcriptional regulator YdaS (Cro superfamily)
MMKEVEMDATQIAIKKAGGPTALARLLGVTPQAVGQWKMVPADKVLQVEQISGVSRHALRPDVFGVEPEIAKEAAE